MVEVQLATPAVTAIINGVKYQISLSEKGIYVSASGADIEIERPHDSTKAVFIKVKEVV